LNLRACLFGLAGLVLAVAGSLPIGGVGARPAFAEAGNKPNACGCYRDSSGSCFCGKKGKCACPGECEPKGCEEKRAKELDKEIAAETKKAASGHVSKDKESASEEGGSKKEKVVHMAPAKKKELLHLLDAYLAEHPEGGSQTVNEVKRTLGSN
jgi:hypothetical protein